MTKMTTLPRGRSKKYPVDCADLFAFTVFTKSRGPLTKRITYNKDGVISKNSSQCWMSDGEAKTVLLSFKDLPEHLNSLKPNQAISLGISTKDKTKICSKRQIDRLLQKGYLTRTLENFHFPEGENGMLLLDFDGNSMSPRKALRIVQRILPELSGIATIITPSASAGLYKKSTGEKLPGSNNAHIYLLVNNASDIPRIGKVLFERLILEEFGRVEFSRDGKILIRTLIDSAVFSPERLIFEAKAILRGDIEYRDIETEYIPGKALNTEDIKDLSNIERIQFESTLRELRSNAQEEAAAIRKLYINEEGAKIAKDLDLPLAEGKSMAENRSKSTLSGEDMLYFDDQSEPTIRKILKDPQKYNQKTLADPAEPEYGGRRNKAILYYNLDDGTVLIYSFAHGGRIYFLKHDSKDLKEIIENGEKRGTDEYANLIANAAVSTLEQEELLLLLHKKLKIGLSLLRSTLKAAKDKGASTFHDKQEKYETSETDTLNLKYGFVTIGGKSAVIEEKYDDVLKCWIIVYHRANELEQFYSNCFVTINAKPVNIFKAWMTSSTRNTFEGIQFLPDSSKFRDTNKPIQQGGTYNSWQGYMVAPEKGDCSLILNHIFEVWCNKNEEMYNYVLDWLADMFQNPNRQGKTAIVLRSGQGAGKNIIADGVIAYIFGAHALIANRAEDFLGRFNSALGHAVFVFVNEAVWAGNRDKKGVLKALITDKYITIERKYFDSVRVRNFNHLLFASNESWVVPAEPGDRRYAYLDVSDIRRNDTAYFQKLGSQINNQGRAAFLYEMLNRDLSNVDLTKLPKQQSHQRLTDQLQSGEVHIKFMHDLLSDPYFNAYQTDDITSLTLKGDELHWGPDGWQPSKELFYSMYLKFTGRMKGVYPQTKGVLIRQINQALPELLSAGKRTATNGTRTPFLNFLPMKKARTKFNECTELNVIWED